MRIKPQICSSHVSFRSYNFENIVVGFILTLGASSGEDFQEKILDDTNKEREENGEGNGKNSLELSDKVYVSYAFVYLLN